MKAFFQYILPVLLITLLLIACGGGGGGSGGGSGDIGDWVTLTRLFHAVTTADLNRDDATDAVVTQYKYSERYTCDQRDGKLDCNTQKAWEYDAVVYLQETLTPGKFMAGAEYSLEATAPSLQSGDLNQDGIPDLVIAQMVDKSVRVFLNDAGNPGRFIENLDVGVIVQPRCVAIGDLNGDDLNDIAVAGNDVVLLENNPATPGSSFNVRSLGMENITCLSIGDINGDNRNDLATISEDEVIVVLQAPVPATAGTFLPGNPYPARMIASDIEIEDLNNDTLPDLAVAIRSELDSAAMVYSQEQLSPGTFFPASIYPIAQISSKLAIGDLNNDVHPDIAVANYRPESGGVSVLLQDTLNPGTFPSEVIYPGLYGPYDVAIGDMNADGYADLLIADNITLPIGSAYILFQDIANPGTFPDRKPLPPLL